MRARLRRRSVNGHMAEDEGFVGRNGPKADL